LRRDHICSLFAVSDSDITSSYTLQILLQPGKQGAFAGHGACISGLFFDHGHHKFSSAWRPVRGVIEDISCGQRKQTRSEETNTEDKRRDLL